MNIYVDGQRSEYSPVDTREGALETRPGRSSRTALLAVMAGILVVGIVAITISGSADASPSMPASQAPRTAANTQMAAAKKATTCGDWSDHRDTTLFQDTSGALTVSPWCQGKKAEDKCVPGTPGAEKIRTMKCPLTCGYCGACTYAADHNSDTGEELSPEMCVSGPGAYDYCKSVGGYWMLENSEDFQTQVSTDDHSGAACPKEIQRNYNGGYQTGSIRNGRFKLDPYPYYLQATWHTMNTEYGEFRVQKYSPTNPNV